MTFDRFIQAGSNRLAALALRNLTPGALGSRSLLLIAPGPWGKTHLLEALARASGLKSPTWPWPCLRLTADPGQPPPDLTQIRAAGLILVDDVHLLAGRPDRQQRLAQAFDDPLGPASLVVSSPCPPQQLTSLSESLRSRLGGGLVLAIERPEYDLMLEIGARLAGELNLALSPEIMSALARAAKSDPRCLQGYLRTLAFIMTNTRLTPGQALRRLGLTNAAHPPGGTISLETIVNCVADSFGLKVSDLTALTRSRQLAWPRRVVMFLARELTDQTTTQIGQALGGRDHSTVIHALKTIQADLKNPAMAQLLENIKRSLLISPPPFPSADSEVSPE
ncbi:MAG: hypothetical protein LBP55_00985 [Candidatus Adiutrix sp.]|jgi:chromosomal replication initiator protein|nr:hypothetical protein [Candidatus Adiutrix sp.]